MTSLRANNTGFTLVELMFAMLITMVGLLGLLKSIEVALEHNLKNAFRNEAVLIGEEVMNAMKTSSFDTVFSPYTTIPTRLRGMSKSYVVARQVTQLYVKDPKKTNAEDANNLLVTVSWAYKNISSHHEVKSTRSRGM